MTVERAARAGAWSGADIVLRQGVQFGVSVVLARLLSPEDFGLITLLSFFSSLSIIFVQSGLSTALVQRQETTREEESAAFWCNLFASGVFALILIAIAPAVAIFYSLPLLDPLMYVAAAQVVLAALGAVHSSLLTRHLQFRKLTLVGVVSSLASAVLGVAAALAGFGVWALAVQLISVTVVGNIVLWVISDWRPQLRFRLSALRKLFGFGAFLSLSTMLETLYGNGVVLIIGKFYGPTDVGYFARAHSVQALPTGIISSIISRTTLPLFAARIDEPDALRRGFRMAASFAMLISLPMMAGLALLSDLVVLSLFGAKWMPTAPVVAIAAWGGALVPLHVINLTLLLARGDSRQFLRLEIWKKVVGVAAVGVGCFYGIVGVAYAATLIGVISFFINAVPTRRSLGYGAWRQLWDLRDVIGATAVMSAVVLLAGSVVAFSPEVSLAVLSATGAVTYLAVGFLLRLPSFTSAFATASLLAKRTPAPVDLGMQGT